MRKSNSNNNNNNNNSINTTTTTNNNIKHTPTFKSHMTSPVEYILSDDTMIDISLLHKICFTSGVDEKSRSLTWKLLLGYLTPNKEEWNAKLEASRSSYWKFVQEFIIHPGDVQPEGDHPLSTETNSSWNSFFEDNKILLQINYDTRRLYPDLSFFQMPTDYPCRLEGIGKLRTRVEPQKLATCVVQETKFGICNFMRQRTDSLYNSISDKSNNKSEAHWEVIERLLFIYSKLNPGISYVQGMNELIGPIYYVFGNDSNFEWRKHAEADSFFCFTKLMCEVGDHFCKAMDHTQYGIKAMMSKLMQAVKTCDTKLYEALIAKNIDPHYFSFRWITLLLSQEFFLPELIELWDYLLSDKDRFNFLYCTCCSMLILQRRLIIDGNFADTIKLLQNYPPTPLSRILHTALEVKTVLAKK